MLNVAIYLDFPRFFPLDVAPLMLFCKLFGPGFLPCCHTLFFPYVFSPFLSFSPWAISVVSYISASTASLYPTYPIDFFCRVIVQKFFMNFSNCLFLYVS